MSSTAPPTSPGSPAPLGKRRLVLLPKLSLPDSCHWLKYPLSSYADSVDFLSFTLHDKLSEDLAIRVHEPE